MRLVQPRQLLAVLLATILLALLLVLASLDSLFQPEPPPRVLLREVNLYTPPPPPPPPTTATDSSRMAGPVLLQNNQTVALDLQLMDLNVSLPTGQFGDFGGGLGGEMGGVGVDWGTVSLSELDALPVVKRANVLATMSRLNRELRGDSIEVMFHIVIDENGKVHPVRILESSHPQFNAEMMAFAATVEFTPPTVLGLPVRTEYRWPVKLDAK